MGAGTGRVRQTEDPGQSLQRQERPFSQTGLRGLRCLLRSQGMALHRPVPPHHLAVQRQIYKRGTLSHSRGGYRNHTAAFHKSLQFDDAGSGADY